MAKKLSSAIGVDLGSRYIKVAEVKLQGRQPVVTALGIAETPEGAVDHMGVHDPKAVGAVLKQLMASSGCTSGDVILSLAGQGSVLVRTLEVPTMNDGELKQHMDWEITRNIPFSESTVVSDYKAFPPDQPGAQNMDVVMAIAPQSVVDMMVDLVKASGKKAGAFDVEPLGLARCLKVGYDTELAGKTVCVVEVGHKTTAINIYKDGRLLMPRQVPVGGEMITRALADGLALGLDEAEQVKCTRAMIPASASQPATAASTQAFAAYNPFADTTPAAYNPFAPDDAGAPAPGAAAPAPASSAPAEDPEVLRVYSAMAPIIEELMQEVRRSVDYFRSKGGDIDQILLTGGGCKLKGLDSYLAGILGVNVRLMDPLQGISMSARKADPAMIDNARQDFVVAVGNGLHVAF
jgi:type IV pilus assembly protein PilM